MSAPFPSIWNLPANPVFRRHAVARLRPLPLVVWILVTQTLAGFGWALGFLGKLRLESEDDAGWNFTSPEFRDILAEHGLEAAMIGWIMVLGLQWVILFLKGTFSVATGVARESGEGMMDAQRLTPMPTGHKVVGQLLGLPVRENLVAGLLTVWVLPSTVFGGLPVMLVVKVYLISAASALLHHAIGLVSGTIIRQKILAGTLSQLLVIILNFGLPLAGYFGIGAISHLGASMAFTELLQVHLGNSNPFEREETTILWFGHPLPAAFYTWVLIVISLTILTAIIYRRWNDETSQLLGKPGTIAAVAALLVVSWGEFHDFTPDMDWIKEFSVTVSYLDSERELISDMEVDCFAWIGGYAIVLGLLNFFAAAMLAPMPVQRSLYRHSSQPRPWHDGAPAIPWLLALCLLTSVTFHGVSQPMLEAAGAPSLHPATPWAVTAAFAVPVCVCLLAIVRLGWRGAAMLAFFFGVLPFLLAALAGVITGDLSKLEIWILAASGVLLPAFAWFSGHGDQLATILRLPFLVSLGLHTGLLVWLAIRKPALPPTTARDVTGRTQQSAVAIEP